MYIYIYTHRTPEDSRTAYAEEVGLRPAVIITIIIIYINYV